MPKNPKQAAHKACTGFVWRIPFPSNYFSTITIIPRSHSLQTKRMWSADQNTRPFPEVSPITAEAMAGSRGAAVLVQELGSGLKQPSTGDTARLRSSRSIEGRRGLRRLTGQNAEPPWGVKFILLGSGQEEMTAGFSFWIVLEKIRKRNKRSFNFFNYKNLSRFDSV